MKTHPLVESIDRARLADDLWRLVNIPSPTRHERDVAMAFAEMLEKAGAEVRLDERIPDSPNVIGRLRGARPGRTLQLAGHMDHIDIPHPPPQRSDEVISGRGSADMKCGLAAVLEVVRLLSESGRDFPGEILVTTYGLHEAPHGDSRGLLNLIDDEILGHAALVFEGRNATQCENIVAGKGQSIWNVKITRPNEACHELHRDDRADDLLAGCREVIGTLETERSRLHSESHAHPLLGRESLFVGQVHYGDFYNRAPSVCTLQGTRRWNPQNNFDAVRREFSEFLNGIELPAGLSIESDWIFVGESYAVQPDEPIIQAFQSACRSLLDTEAQYIGTLGVLDGSRLVPLGHIPIAACGLGGEGGHADYEFVPLDEMHRCCGVAVQTVLNYLETQEADHGK